MPERQWTGAELDRECARPSCDRELRAAWYLLRQLDNRVEEAFVGDPPGLDNGKLLSMSWSSTECEIARAACALYNNRSDVSLFVIANLFDAGQIARLRKAVDIYRGDARWQAE